jgi:hypothetical protein
MHIMGQQGTVHVTLLAAVVTCGFTVLTSVMDPHAWPPTDTSTSLLNTTRVPQ